MSTPMQEQARGFFSSLFDFSFTSNVTPKLIKIIYGIVMVVAGLSALVLVAAAFSANAVAGIFVLLIVAPIAFFFYLILYRVLLEVVMAVFKIAENTSRLASAASGVEAPSGPPGSSPFAPQPPAWGQPGPASPGPWSGDQPASGLPPAPPLPPFPPAAP